MPPFAVSLVRIHVTAITYRVLNVLRIGANTEIHQSVVARVIIQVTDHVMSPGPESDECLSDHMGDLDAPFPAVFREADADPLTLVRRRLQDSPLLQPRSSVLGLDYPVFAPDSPKS